MKIFSVALLAILASTAFVVSAIAGMDDGITKYGGEGTLTAATFPPEKTGESIASENSISAGPALVTFTVVNKHSAAIGTSHAHQAGGPTAFSGYVGEGTMAPNATASFVVPRNWSGNVAVNDASHEVNGNVSLIEANYFQNTWSKVPVVDVDVSYV